MSPEVLVAGPFRAGEPLSLGPPPGLGTLAADGGEIIRSHPSDSAVLATLFCEDCGAQRSGPFPRCEHCEQELGGEAGR
jgi:hypothetical protein